MVLELLFLGFRSGGFPWRLVRVVRRGQKELVDVELSPEAAEALEDYLREVRGRGPGWLLRSRQGRPLATRDVERGVGRVLSTLPAVKHRSRSRIRQS